MYCNKLLFTFKAGVSNCRLVKSVLSTRWKDYVVRKLFPFTHRHIRDVFDRHRPIVLGFGQCFVQDESGLGRRDLAPRAGDLWQPTAWSQPAAVKHSILQRKRRYLRYDKRCARATLSLTPYFSKHLKILRVHFTPVVLSRRTFFSKKFQWTTTTILPSCSMFSLKYFKKTYIRYF